MYACVRYVSSAFGSLQLFCVHRPRARVLCVETAVAAISMFGPARPAASSQPSSYSGLYGWIASVESAVRSYSRTAAVSGSDRHTAAVSGRSGGAEAVHPEPPGLVNAAGSDRSSGDQSLLEKTLNAASEVFCRRPQGSWEPWGNPMDEAVDDRQFVPREEEEEEEVEHASDREDSWGRPMDELPEAAPQGPLPETFPKPRPVFEDCAESVRGRHSEPTRGTNSCTSGPCWADAAPDVEVPAAWQDQILTRAAPDVEVPAPPDMEEPAPSRRRICRSVRVQIPPPVDSDGSDSDAGGGETVGESTEDDLVDGQAWKIEAEVARFLQMGRRSKEAFERRRESHQIQKAWWAKGATRPWQRGSELTGKTAVAASGKGGKDGRRNEGGKGGKGQTAVAAGESLCVSAPSVSSPVWLEYRQQQEAMVANRLWELSVITSSLSGTSDEQRQPLHQPPQSQWGWNGSHGDWEGHPNAEWSWEGHHWKQSHSDRDWPAHHW